MKTLLFASLLLACALPLRADILANGSFADGTAHWSGDAHASTDWNNQGITINLDSSKWTKVSQIFNTRENAFDFSITYKTSPDCSFGTSGAKLSIGDLADMTGLRFKKAINLKAGTWLLLITDPAALYAQWDMIKPTVGLPNGQTVKGTFPKLAAHEEKTMYIAFPPGQGSITLLNVALTPTDAAAAPSASPFPTP